MSGVGTPGTPSGPRTVAEGRIDRFIWSVRLFKTRTEATDACRGGHVRINGTPAKPASTVRPGDRVTVRGEGRERVLEVVAVIERRGSAQVAASCVVDRSPAPVAREADAPAFVRDRSAGRPTKRDRRQLDRMRRQ